MLRFHGKRCHSLTYKLLQVLVVSFTVISFLQFSITGHVITTLCADCATLQEKLQTYETHFNEYIKRRVFESSIYYCKGTFEIYSGTAPEDVVELILITDES